MAITYMTGYRKTLEGWVCRECGQGLGDPHVEGCAIAQLMEDSDIRTHECYVLRVRVEALEAALLHIENGCSNTETWEVEDHVRDVIEAVRCTARDALAAKDGEE